MFHNSLYFTRHLAQNARRIRICTSRHFHHPGLNFPAHGTRLPYCVVGSSLCADGLIRDRPRTRQRNIRFRLGGPRARLRHGQRWRDCPLRPQQNGTRTGVSHTPCKRHVWLFGTLLFGHKLYYHTRRRPHSQNRRCGVSYFLTWRWCGGEVAESELLADGVDMFAVFGNFSKRQVETLPQSNSSPAWSLVLVVLKNSLHLHPFRSFPNYQTKLPILVGFKEWASAQQNLDPACKALSSHVGRILVR